MPDTNHKKSWRKKNTHRKANARALTAAEIADRNLKAQERQDKKQRTATPDHVLGDQDEEIQVPATPEREPPASTAPARLEGEDEGRGKRKRKVTDAYRQARQAGLQSLSYSQVE